MHTYLRNCLALLSFIACTVACDNDPEAVVYKEPTATFSIESDHLTSTVGDNFELIAYPQPEGKVYSKWFIDDVLEASTATLSYQFTSPGIKKVRYLAKNGAGEFSKEFTVEVNDILKVNLSIGDVSQIELKQFEELKVIALVSAGSNIQHQWEIDGTVVSTERILEGFMLNELKTYHVKYTATNSAGTFVKEFDVKTLDRPLEINFSVMDETIRMTQGNLLEIVANVLYGGAGAVHDWKINGKTVSITNTISNLCTEIGIFEITYKCVNELDETITHSWNLEVTDGTWMVATFEDNSYDDVRFTAADKTLSVIENPNKTGMNTSGYCFQQFIPNNVSTSGIIWLSFREDISAYKGIKFKYYKFSNDRKVQVDMNDTSTSAIPVVEGGVNKDGSAASVETWMEVEFRFPTSFTTPVSRLTLRVLKMMNDKKETPVKALIDDIQLIP